MRMSVPQTQAWEDDVDKIIRQVEPLSGQNKSAVPSPVPAFGSASHMLPTVTCLKRACDDEARNSSFNLHTAVAVTLHKA